MWNFGDDNERKENVNERYFKYGESEEKKEASSRYSRTAGSAGASRASGAARDTAGASRTRATYADQQTGSIRKKKSAWGKVIPMSIAAGAIAGGIFVAIAATGNHFITSSAQQQLASASAVTETTSQSADGINIAGTFQSSSTGTAGIDVKSIAASMMPCMVELNGKSVFSQQTFFGTQQYEAASSGTGIIIGKSDDELLILTNAHVVEDIDDLQSMFIDGSVVNAVIKGSDASVDVAVVAVKLADISTETMDAINIAQLDDTKAAELGEQVVAIGNALGEGQSVTVGYVSATDRSITVEGTTYSGLLMTDAAINSGNSGGALVNGEGKVVGINFASSDYTVENMAYAIPIVNVKDLINSMMTQETREVVSEAEASYLGISGVDITGEMHQMYGYPQGLMLRTVEKGSPADNAGLSQYDIITSFDGKSVTTLTGLQNVMKYYKAGETVTIEYYHMENNEYAERSTEVTLGARK